jgi:hypothetical protein
MRRCGVVCARHSLDALKTWAFSNATSPTFPVDHPDLFDAVVMSDDSRVVEIQVKRSEPDWGAPFRMPGTILHDLHGLWCARAQRDEYMSTLINAYILRGGQAYGVRAGRACVDVGTLKGYREALQLLTAPEGRAAGPELATIVGTATELCPRLRPS